MPNSISNLCWQLLACHLSAGYRLAAWLCSGWLSVGPPCLCLHKITAFQFWPALKQTQTLFICLPCGSPPITRQRRSFTLPSYLTLLSGRDRGHLGFITVSRSVSFWGWWGQKFKLLHHWILLMGLKERKRQWGKKKERERD